MLIPFGVFSAGVSGGDSGGGSFDLISSTILASATSSVTFDVTGLGSTYKHLQIRFVGRGNRSDVSEPLHMRLNSDSGNNYSWHNLSGNGSSVSPDASTSTNYMRTGELASANASSNIFGSGVIDMLDPFSTSKNKTLRSFSGAPAYLMLKSSAWYSTSAVTSISLTTWSGTNFVIGSRFSLYGIKG